MVSKRREHSNIQFDLLDGIAATIGLLFALEAPTEIASDDLHVIMLIFSALATILLTLMESISNEKYKRYRVPSAVLALIFRVLAYLMRTTKLDNSIVGSFLVASDIFCLIVISLVAASVKNARISFIAFTIVLLCAAIDGWVIFHLKEKTQSDTTKVFRIVSGILIGLSILLLGAVRS